MILSSGRIPPQINWDLHFFPCAPPGHQGWYMDVEIGSHLSELNAIHTHSLNMYWSLGFSLNRSTMSKDKTLPVCGLLVHQSDQQLQEVWEMRPHQYNLPGTLAIQEQRRKILDYDQIKHD